MGEPIKDGRVVRRLATNAIVFSVLLPPIGIVLAVMAIAFANKSGTPADLAQKRNAKIAIWLGVYVIVSALVLWGFALWNAETCFLNLDEEDPFCT